MRDSPFTGKRKMHEGLDIAARTGTPVYACADGIVSQAETAPGYGKLVVIDHGYGYKTYYAHNSKIFVKVGRARQAPGANTFGRSGRSGQFHRFPRAHYGVPARRSSALNPAQIPLITTLSRLSTSPGFPGLFCFCLERFGWPFRTCGRLRLCAKLPTFAGGCRHPAQ
ncbi:M23 family metallopeptidase [Desulfuromonas carbonis]